MIPLYVSKTTVLYFRPEASLFGLPVRIIRSLSICKSELNSLRFFLPIAMAPKSGLPSDGNDKEFMADEIPLIIRGISPNSSVVV